MTFQFYRCKLSYWHGQYSNNGTAVSHNFVVRNLSSVLNFLGLNSNLYKGHSFRIGAATHAASLGWSESQIRRLGRWNSNAMERYIRISSFKLQA